jgi:hypothetical protein
MNVVLDMRSRYENPDAPKSHSFVLFEQLWQWMAVE